MGARPPWTGPRRAALAAACALAFLPPAGRVAEAAPPMGGAVAFVTLGGAAAADTPTAPGAAAAALLGPGASERYLDEMAAVPVPSIRAAVAANPAVGDDVLENLAGDRYDSVSLAAQRAWLARYPKGPAIRRPPKSAGTKSVAVDSAELRELIDRGSLTVAAIIWRHLPAGVRSELLGVCSWDPSKDKLQPLLEFIVQAEPPGGPLAHAMCRQILTTAPSSLPEMAKMGLLPGLAAPAPPVGKADARPKAADAAVPERPRAAAGPGIVTLAWAPVKRAAGYLVYRNGELISDMPVPATGYTDNSAYTASASYEVQAVDASCRLTIRSAPAVVATQLRDSDERGLPDRWQMHYFGHLGVDPGADPDGDGMTNLEEYRKGTDPTDFFNGEDPRLEALNGATPIDGESLGIIVRHADGRPWANAPVTWKTTKGVRLLCAVRDQPPYVDHLTVRSDATGRAQCFLQPLPKP